MAGPGRDEGRPPSEGAPWDWGQLLIQWCAEDLPPGDFWRQTPRTLALILEGRGKAAERRIEMAMFAAWQTAMFERTERLQGLSHYLDKLKPQKPRRKQTAEEMIAVLRAIKASKEPMN